MRTRLQVNADRAAETLTRSIGQQLRHVREDAGLPRTVVAASAGLHPSYLRLVELGEREASIGALCRLSMALGADLSLRLFPNSGPPLRDRFQARMVEALFALLPDDWERHVEVTVARPVRGVIDAVLARRVTADVVSVEAHSEIRRLEQQLRWAAEKSEALPSSAIWPALTRMSAVPPTVSRILLLRSTVATRALAREFGSTLAAAYPAEAHDIRAALLDPSKPWPGNGILWVTVDGARTTVLRGRPRGVSSLAFAGAAATGSR